METRDHLVRTTATYICKNKRLTLANKYFVQTVVLHLAKRISARPGSAQTPGDVLRWKRWMSWWIRACRNG